MSERIKQFGDRANGWQRERKTTKLTQENAQIIKQLLRDGIPTSELAEQFGVCVDAIRKIRQGRRWGKLK